jgi:YVTN family beta-propeller protein
MTMGYLYVPNEADNTVSKIDTSNDTVIATIPLSGNTPDGVAVSPNGTVVYVASESGLSMLSIPRPIRLRQLSRSEAGPTS